MQFQTSYPYKLAECIVDQQGIVLQQGQPCWFSEGAGEIREGVVGKVRISSVEIHTHGRSKPITLKIKRTREERQTGKRVTYRIVVRDQHWALGLPE